MVYLHAKLRMTVPVGSWTTTTETEKRVHATAAYFSQLSHYHLSSVITVPGFRTRKQVSLVSLPPYKFGRQPCC